MAIYQFRADDGEVVERVFPMSAAPPLGAVIEQDGKRYRRILSDTTETIKQFKPYVSVAAPRRAPGFKHDPKTGRTVIETPADERRMARFLGHEWE